MTHGQKAALEAECNRGIATGKSWREIGAALGLIIRSWPRWSWNAMNPVIAKLHEAQEHDWNARFAFASVNATSCTAALRAERHANSDFARERER
jgi:hypothetical protein